MDDNNNGTNNTAKNPTMQPPNSPLTKLKPVHLSAEDDRHLANGTFGADGSAEYYGRLKVFHNAGWVTVSP